MKSSIAKGFLKHVAKGIGGGICIGIGGTAFLCSKNQVIGAVIFSVGLLSIYFFGLDLYTGKAGYVVNRPVSYIFEEVLSSWIGNFLGAASVAKLLSLTARGAALAARASEISNAKLNTALISQFILAIFCGLMVFFMVDMYYRYRERSLPVAIFYSILCIAAFLTCGFEHSIADIYFFTMAGLLLKNIPAILLISLGNLVGGNLEPAAKRACAAIFREKPKVSTIQSEHDYHS